MKPLEASQINPLLGMAWLTVCLGVTGCSKSEETDVGMPKNPTEAASQLESAFGQASEAARTAAAAAAAALRQKDYEKAVVSLQTVRSTENVTLDQGLAVHGTIVALEAELVSAVQSGDPKAKQAYELLKALKRK